jgi:hypothetical protein
MIHGEFENVDEVSFSSSLFKSIAGIKTSTILMSHI